MPLAGHLMRKDTLDEVIAFHDAEKKKNKINVVFKFVALVSSSDI